VLTVLFTAAQDINAATVISIKNGFRLFNSHPPGAACRAGRNNAAQHS